MALADRLAELNTRERFGMRLGLDRVRGALADLGDPHLALACVHVAGSNGKGSTCAMVESIARAAGLRTGLYTSPHLARFAERIRIDGEPIDDAAFDAALLVALAAAQRELTFFECLTVAAFVAFRAAGVDLAVLEVGLGGRLDATNVIERPLACAITSIALEHTSVLGATRPAIAREKAGILKAGAAFVVPDLVLEVEEAIDGAAAAVSAGPKWRVLPEDSARGGDVRYLREGRGVSVTGPGGLRATAAELGLAGRHQAANAAVACALAWRLAERWPAIRDAIPQGLASARWPGRFERIVLPSGATVILDGAHNEEGTRALVETLHDEGVAPSRTTLVFGALSDKPFGTMLGIVAPCASRRIYTSPKGRAPAPLDELDRVAPGDRVADPFAALSRALGGASWGDFVLVTGSLYLVGELRAHLLGIDADPVVAL